VKLVDARNGQELRVGQTVSYPDSADGYTLLAARGGISTVTFLVRQQATGRVIPVVGPVRYFHPKGAGPLSRVGIFPS